MNNKRTIKAARKYEDEQEVLPLSTKRQPKPRKIMDANIGGGMQELVVNTAAANNFEEEVKVPI